MAKGYDIGNCNDAECQYFDVQMELNCSYSLDNSKCWKQERDTIIPQKLALYEDMKMIFDTMIKWGTLENSSLKPCALMVIDRAKKIEEQ